MVRSDEVHQRGTGARNGVVVPWHVTATGEYGGGEAVEALRSGCRGAVKGARTRSAQTSRRCASVAGVVLFYVLATVLARRRGYSGLGGRTLVRCRDGHLFRTIWVPGVSVKSVRLGWWRWQYCPVGRHWTMVRPVKESDVAPPVDEHGDPVAVPVDIALP